MLQSLFFLHAFSSNDLKVIDGLLILHDNMKSFKTNFPLPWLYGCLTMKRENILDRLPHLLRNGGKARVCTHDVTYFQLFRSRNLTRLLISVRISLGASSSRSSLHGIIYVLQIENS